MADVTDGDSGHEPDGDAMDLGDYCRHVEAYLCQKNDGHLIRIAGPSFTRVSGWARDGIPLAIVYRGVDRYFERYYARGQRRRPVHIDFCEGDVLAVFDEWRRAVGFHGAGEPPDGEACLRAAEENHAAKSHRGRRGADRQAGAGSVALRETGQTQSLQAHLERVIVRLTTLRAGGRLTPAADAAVDAAIRELDGKRGQAALLDGEARLALLGRLHDLDAQLLAAVAAGVGERERRAVEHQAEQDLAAFRAAMSPEGYERALAGNRAKLLRERTGLPIITYGD